MLWQMPWKQRLAQFQCRNTSLTEMYRYKGIVTMSHETVNCRLGISSLYSDLWSHSGRN